MAFIPDLQVLRDPVDSSFRALDPAPVRFDYRGAPCTVTVFAVGWLGDTVESRGDTPAECIRTLLNAYETGCRFSDGTMGSHACEVCPPTRPRRGYHHHFAWNGRRTTLYGHGHHMVLHGESLFICPALILHYIVDHQYRPPTEFIEAVLRGRVLVPGEDDVVSPGGPLGPSAHCDRCEQPARYWRDGLLPCTSCYQAQVPSWDRRPVDAVEAVKTTGPDNAVADPTGLKHMAQRFRLGRYWALSLLAAVIFTVATLEAVRSSEWADAVITAPIALMCTVNSLWSWRRMRAAPEEAAEDA